MGPAVDEHVNSAPARHVSRIKAHEATRASPYVTSCVPAREVGIGHDCRTSTVQPLFIGGLRWKWNVHCDVRRISVPYWWICCMRLL